VWRHEFIIITESVGKKASCVIGHIAFNGFSNELNGPDVILCKILDISNCGEELLFNIGANKDISCISTS
jgi:hypothetical protein